MPPSIHSLTWKIAFLDVATIPERISIAKPKCQHHWQSYASTTPQQVLERLQNIDIAVINKVILNADLLSQLPELKMIALTATGTNNVDLEYCTKNNIQVVNVTDYASDTVAEDSILKMLALSRNLLGYRQDVLQGKWENSPQFCLNHRYSFDLKGKILAIVGRGAIGQRVAELAQAFGMQVIFLDITTQSERTKPRKGYVSFTEGISVADIISIHCPLNPNSQNLFNCAVFEQMKSTALLINTARGGIINEIDLSQAIQTKSIAGVALDVVEHEPIRPDSPLKSIMALDNVIITPHSSWASDEAMQALVNKAISNIDNFTENTVS